jgi:hypothetical protein
MGSALLCVTGNLRKNLPNIRLKVTDGQHFLQDIDRKAVAERQVRQYFFLNIKSFDTGIMIITLIHQAWCTAMCYSCRFGIPILFSLCNLWIRAPAFGRHMDSWHSSQVGWKQSIGILKKLIHTLGVGFDSVYTPDKQSFTADWISVTILCIKYMLCYIPRVRNLRTHALICRYMQELQPYHRPHLQAPATSLNLPCRVDKCWGNTPVYGWILNGNPWNVQVISSIYSHRSTLRP